MNTQIVLKNQLKRNIPDIRPGQVVRVHERIQENVSSKKGSEQIKERVQIFEGLVIATKHGRSLDGTFTVRKIGAGGIGVERIFPIHMPAIEKIEVLRQEKVRRAKLYYVRGQVGKKTKKRKTKLQGLVFDMSVQEEEKQTVEDSTENEVEEKPTNNEVHVEEKEDGEPKKEQSEVRKEAKDGSEKETPEVINEEGKNSKKEEKPEEGK